MQRNRNGSLQRNILSNSEIMEMLGCIIDIFEDFLEDRGITIENDEKEDDENAAIIYGSDYDLLTSDIELVLVEAGILNMRCSSTGNECQMCTDECKSRY